MEPSDVPSSTGQGLSSQAELGLTQGEQENSDITALSGGPWSCFGWRTCQLAIIPNLDPQFIPSLHLTTDILVPVTTLSHLNLHSSL